MYVKDQHYQGYIVVIPLFQIQEESFRGKGAKEPMSHL